jgi:hypothetical protein
MHSKVTQPIGQEHLPSLLLDQPAGERQELQPPMMQPPPQPLEDQMQLSGGRAAVLRIAALQQFAARHAMGGSALSCCAIALSYNLTALTDTSATPVLCLTLAPCCLLQA